MKTLYSTIIICSLILGGSLLIYQHNKQTSIEKQTQWKLEQEREEMAREEEIRQDEEDEKRSNDISYTFCVDRAEESYWDYIKLNGTENKDGSVTALDKFWDRGDRVKQNEIDNCYRQYKK